jgi:hypothetical protein
MIPAGPPDGRGGAGSNERETRGLATGPASHLPNAAQAAAEIGRAAGGRPATW